MMHIFNPISKDIAHLHAYNQIRIMCQTSSTAISYDKFEIKDSKVNFIKPGHLCTFIEIKFKEEFINKFQLDDKKIATILNNYFYSNSNIIISTNLTRSFLIKIGLDNNINFLNRLKFTINSENNYATNVKCIEEKNFRSMMNYNPEKNFKYYDLKEFMLHLNLVRSCLKTNETIHIQSSNNDHSYFLPFEIKGSRLIDIIQPVEPEIQEVFEELARIPTSLWDSQEFLNAAITKFVELHCKSNNQDPKRDKNNEINANIEIIDNSVNTSINPFE